MVELDDPIIAYKEWLKSFPQYVTNKAFDVKEDSFSYLLRHTQLMPRQIIACANEIQTIFDKESTSIENKISDQMFRRGIDNSETHNSLDVLSAFEPIFPGAGRVCTESLKKFGSWLRLEDISKETIPNIEEFDLYHRDIGKFIRLLCEAGILGRARPSLDTKDYRVALFEHEMNNSLRLEESDTLYVHPMFLKHLGINRGLDRLDKPTSSKKVAHISPSKDCQKSQFSVSF